jgi:O-acetyl-ADP-ribose deacetylase (regulator of RNase III)
MFEEWRVNGRLLRVVTGDLLELDVEAVVYYARPDLALGSGYGGAIAAKGGPKVQEELKKLAPLDMTKAVVTSGGNLKAKYVIHGVGPRFQEEGMEEKLRATLESVLRLAEEKKLGSLGFPAMGAGFYGVPLEVCAGVMLGTLQGYLAGKTSLKEVVICLRDSREYGFFEKKLKEMKSA